MTFVILFQQLVRIYRTWQKQTLRRASRAYFEGVWDGHKRNTTKAVQYGQRDSR